MISSSGRRNRRAAFSIGLLITLLTAGAYSLGLFAEADRLLYDYQFRWAPPSRRVPDSGRITHIDIDDDSLSEYGRWPWPRAMLAQVVDELTELGAELIVLDIIMPEPQAPRLATSPFGRHYDLIGPSRLFSDDAGPQFTQDDRVLSESMARSGRVFLAMHFEVEDPESDRDGGAPATQPDRDGLAKWLLTPAGERWVDQRVQDLLGHRPDMTPRQAAEAIHPPAAWEAGPVQDVVFNAYRKADSMRLLTRYSLEADSTAGQRTWLQAVNAVPPVPELARSAAGAGFVYFQPDPDGTVRAIPLAMRWRGRLYPQLALLIACRLTGVELSDVRAEDGWLVLPDASASGGARGEVRIPLVEDGQMLINWRMGPHPGRWDETFDRAPIRALLGIARNRRVIEENRTLLRLAGPRGVELALAGDKSRLDQYVNAWQLLRDPARAEALPDQFRAEALLSAGQQVADFERIARESLRAEYDRLSARTDLGRAESDRLDAIRDIAEPLFEPEKVNAECDRLVGTIRSQQTELRPRVSGRVCFVGSTATGAADFVPTPVFSRCPGVVVHSNILNTILTRRFIRRVPRWINLLAILVCGLAASAITAVLGPRLGALLVFATMAAVAGFNMLVVFQRWESWMVLAGPLAGVFLIWGFVTAYRQLTEERQRRWVTRALGSYTSPGVARRIAEHPDLLALAGEERVITCFFSDIKGFTPISERLGPERTVALLNRYLNRMTEALLRHEATINKFLGDGVFAFFGAPDVQLDHARRAVAAALDCRDELARLVGDPGDPEAAGLAMRIGVATGPAVVGNCGSARKFDYTAIGDTVNLASRLETANKYFGTSIMLSGPTAEQLDSHYLLRPLGRIVVVGKQQSVAVYELLDEMARAGEQARRRAHQFGQAVALYQQSRFAEAAGCFQAVLADDPCDRAAEAYLALSRTALDQSPGPDWDGAIQLTEK